VGSFEEVWVRSGWMISLVLSLLLPACGADDPAADAVVDGAAYSELHAAADHMGVWSRELAIAIDEAADVSGEVTPMAVTVRTELDHLLREHVGMIALMSAARIDRREAATAAGLDALRRRQDELVTRFETLYDRAVAEELRAIWSTQVIAWVRYAEAVSEEDQAAKRQARETLDTVATDLADLVSDLSGGRVDEPRIADAVRLWFERIADVPDALGAADRSWAEELPPALEEAGRIAGEIARPIVADLRLDGDPDAAAATLRADLDGRMTDTVVLLTMATGDVDDDEAVAGVVRDALATNATALATAVEPHLSGSVAREVGELWVIHDELLLDLARAVASGDEAVADARRDALADWARELGRLLADATGGAVTGEQVVTSAGTHVETMDAVFEAQAGGDAA
jgi:hypothetical protein